MTASEITTGWGARARRLAEGLQRRGVLRDPLWRAAVESVPRHVFVPFFYTCAGGGEFALVDGADPGQRDNWLEAVYSDETLVTQIGSAPVPEPFGGGVQVRPTSSSTRPSLMLRMIEDLDLKDGDRVLEIGTGTGYNAALLCARLGDGSVVSIDIHPDLVETARERLAHLGYTPALGTGDGMAGRPDAAPYDRIIATAATATIPPAWVEQTRRDGIILADLRGDIAGGMVKVRKVGAEAAVGHFLGYPGWFMWLRPRADHPLRDGEPPQLEVDKRDGRRRHSPIDPHMLSEPQFTFIAQLHLPRVRLFRPASDEEGYLLVSTTDNSWAETSPGRSEDGRYQVMHGGHRDLWAAVEQAHQTWSQAGRPSPERFGVTATPTHQHAWLDDPDGAWTWDLPL